MARVLAPCKTVRTRQGSLGGCVAAMPAIKLPWPPLRTALANELK